MGTEYEPVMKILFGPSGTGKTYRAAREAVQIIDGVVDERNFAERHSQLVENKQVWWVTFHPNYSYEDFVEGFRPIEQDGQVIYKVKDGPFKLACEACQSTDIVDIPIGSKIGESKNHLVIHSDKGGVVLRTENTRRDRITDQIDQYADFWTINLLRERGISIEELSQAGPGVNTESRREIALKTNLPTTLFTNQSHLRALYEEIEARKNTLRPVVLIIDEINRADLSRVFGELFTLLEIDKRQGQREERRVMLPYSQQSFTVPSFLSVIGTMNTTDRSLAVMDIALRRRFEFEEIEPDSSRCPDDYGGVNIQELLDCWNHRITALRSREHRIGHSELMKERLEVTREQKEWSADNEGESMSLAWVIRHKILPQLLEYFYDDWRMAHVVLGKTPLLAEVDFQDISELVEEIVDITENTGYSVPSWWDPDTKEWDGNNFRQSIAESYS
jgi:5-methylcytosine-specific restriction enzyme B